MPKCRFRNLPKSQIPNPKPMPKSQIDAEIPNRCRNPKSLPKSQTLLKSKNPKFRSFPYWRFGISATVWDSGIGLGFRHRFGISASVWDFGIGLGFGISATCICRKVFGIRHIAETFRHPSLF